MFFILGVQSINFCIKWKRDHKVPKFDHDLFLFLDVKFNDHNDHTKVNRINNDHTNSKKN